MKNSTVIKMNLMALAMVVSLPVLANNDFSAKADEARQEISDKAHKVNNEASEQAHKLSNEATESAHKIRNEASEKAHKVKEEVSSTTEKAKNQLSDTSITAKVKEKFIQEKVFGDTDVAAMSIHVKTKKGIVHLTGKADNAEQVKNAISMAQQVDGVKSVESQIKVKK